MAKDQHGFTLLEVLIALTIFMGVVVPLVSALTRAGNTTRARDRITAACLLEQESELVRASSGTPLPRVRRIVNGREWLVKTFATGNELKQYRMEAWKGERMAGEVRFYVYHGEKGD